MSRGVIFDESGLPIIEQLEQRLLLDAVNPITPGRRGIDCVNVAVRVQTGFRSHLVAPSRPINEGVVTREDPAALHPLRR